jgi:hypothetical protein
LTGGLGGGMNHPLTTTVRSREPQLGARDSRRVRSMIAVGESAAEATVASRAQRAGMPPSARSVARAIGPA